MTTTSVPLWRGTSKRCRKWGWFSYLLIWEGADSKTSDMFYVAVMKYVLLFEAGVWVVNPCILKAL